MRVFLDANVVLTGALNSNGPARKLTDLQGRASFIVSPHILSECDYLIRRNAPNPDIAQAVQNATRAYLCDLKALQVPDVAPPNGVTTLDPGDDIVLGTAMSAQADAICTYNVKDFPASQIRASTPLTIHRSISKPILEQYIQPIALSTHGTLLFFGRLHHESSMGTILDSQGHVTVFADDRGFIRLVGSGVKRCRLIKQLQRNMEFRLTLRYNTTDFEAALWTKASDTWLKEIMTTGSADFSVATRPILCFVPEHNFSGHIQCISGLPRYVRDKQMPAALDNYSLEAAAGSLDLKRFMKTLIT